MLLFICFVLKIRDFLLPDDFFKTSFTHSRARVAGMGQHVLLASIGFQQFKPLLHITHPAGHISRGKRGYSVVYGIC